MYLGCISNCLPLTLFNLNINDVRIRSFRGRTTFSFWVIFLWLPYNVSAASALDDLVAVANKPSPASWARTLLIRFQRWEFEKEIMIQTSTWFSPPMRDLISKDHSCQLIWSSEDLWFLNFYWFKIFRKWIYQSYWPHNNSDKSIFMHTCMK